MLARSDEALFQQLLEGELGAFDELYARYERHLYGFILKHLRDPAEAEDVLHEAFLAVLRERDSGMTARSFRAWIFQVTRNLCLNRARARRRAERAFLSVVREPEAEGAPDPDRALEDEERTRALRRAVEKLPPALGELYHLRASGLSYEELAEVLSIPVGTVKSRLHDLVNRLREEVV